LIDDEDIFTRATIQGYAVEQQQVQLKRTLASLFDSYNPLRSEIDKVEKYKL